MSGFSLLLLVLFIAFVLATCAGVVYLLGWWRAGSFWAKEPKNPRPHGTLRWHLAELKRSWWYFGRSLVRHTKLIDMP